MLLNNNDTSKIIEQKYLISRAWFRSTDFWVMGPARSHSATLRSHLRTVCYHSSNYFTLFQTVFHYFIPFQHNFFHRTKQVLSLY